MHFFLKMHKFPPPLKRRHHAILCQKTTQNPATAKCSNGFEADTKQKVRMHEYISFFWLFWVYKRTLMLYADSGKEQYL